MQYIIYNCYVTTTDEIESSIVNELQKIFKWLDFNRLCLNVAKSKFMLFYMPQKIIPNLTFDFNGVHIEQVNEFNFLGLLIDCNLNWKAHLHMVSTKISRVIGLLRKLKYIFPSYILHTIYNSLILPHINYSLLAWGTKCQKIELLQKKAVRVVHSKSPIAHTNPLFKKMNNLRVSDLYTCNLLKMYYKLYRNMLPVYFESFIPEYGDYRHNVRNDQIRLPLIRCEYGEMNVKYQMHLRLRELSTPSNPPKYPSIAINDDTLSKSHSAFSRYVKDEFLSSYNNVCTTPGCYSCEG